MSFIIPLLYFLLLTGFFVFVFKKSFGKCIPISFFFTALSYFFSQVLFKTFKVGFLVNILLVLIFSILLIIKRNDKKILKEFKENYFSLGFKVFLVIYLCVFILDFNRSFSVWDEFSHWGVMVKEMLRLDKFYSNELSTLMVHKDYPPIIQLFEIFYVKLSGGYQETVVYRAIHLLEFSLLIPFIESINKSKNKKSTIIKTLLTLLLSFFIMVLFDQHCIVNSIYIDYPMAMVVSYLMSFVIVKDEKDFNFNLITLFLGFTFLILTKQIAFTLYLMVLTLFIANYILKESFKKVFSKKNIVNLIKIFILLIVIPLLIWKGWNSYVESVNADQQFKLTDLKISELKGVIKGTDGELWQHQAAVNYIKAVKNRNITTSETIKLSYTQCFAITLALLYFLYIYSKKYVHKGQINILSAIMIAGYLGYAFVMLVLYSFSFGPHEGPGLASFDRYMATFVIICLESILMLFSYYSSYKDKELNLYIIILMLLVIIQSPVQFDKLTPKIFNYDKMTSRTNMYEEHANIIKEKVKDDSSIYVIAQDSVGQYQFYVKYYLDKNKTNLHYFNLPVGDEVSDYEEYFNDEVKDYMSEFDYLYLANINNSFVEKYSFLFDNEIENRQLYKINKNDNQIKLELVR